MKHRRGNAILAFAFFVLVLGLLELWIVALILWFSPGVTFSWRLLLHDGGLYFFSTSFVLSGLLTLLDRGSGLKQGSSELVVTLLLGAPVLGLAVVGYTIYFIGTQILMHPISDYAHTLAQSSCAVSAIVYAFYCAAKIGVFRRYE